MKVSPFQWKSHAARLRVLPMLGLVLLLASQAAQAQTTLRLNSTGVMGLGNPNGDFAIAEDDLRVKVPGGYVRVNRDFDGDRWTFNRQWSGLGTPQRYSALYASIGSYYSCTVIDGVSSCDSTAQSGTAVSTVVPEFVAETRIINDDSLGAAGASITELARKGVVFTRAPDGVTYANTKYPRFIVRAQQVRMLPASNGPDAHPALGKPDQPGGLQTALVPGYRWTDRSGEWIEYNQGGRITSYGDRNDVRVWMQYGLHGQVERVLDDNGRTVFTFVYSSDGKFIAEARDHTPFDGVARRVQYRYDDDGRLSSVTDARSHTTSYSYGIRAQVSALSATASTFFKITGVTDAQGRKATLTYDKSTARLSRIVAADSAAIDLSYSYDKLRKEFSVSTLSAQTAVGRKSEVRTYDNEGRLILRVVNGKTLLRVSGSRAESTYIDENANSVVVSRDAFDSITSKRFPDGSRVQFSYASGTLDVAQIVDESGAVERIDRDASGNVTRHEAAKGAEETQVTDYVVNSRGEVETMLRNGGTNADGTTEPDVEVRIVNDANGNPVEVLDGEGKRWRYTYDAQGNLATSEDPLGNRWAFEYDQAGNQLSVTDPNLHTTRYEYDATGLLTKIVDARSKSTVIDYDPAGRLRSVTDPTGAFVQNIYDPAGRLESVTDSLSHQSRLSYDNYDRLVTIDAGGGSIARFGYETEDGDRGSELIHRVDYPALTTLLAYNSRLQQVQSTDVFGSQARTASVARDARGYVVQGTNAYGKTESVTYDSLGRPTTGVDALGRTVTLTHDRRDNVVAVRDERGNSTRFVFDRRDLKVLEIDPLGKATSYVYDDAGRLSEVLRPNGARIRFEVDPGGRPIRRNLYHPNGQIELTDTFQWDEANRLVGWTSGSSHSESTYDDAGRLLQETVSVAGMSMTRRYTYHANGQVATYTGPDGQTIAYAYDQAGSIDQISLPGTGAISVLERLSGLPTRTSFPGGAELLTTRAEDLSPVASIVRSADHTVVFEQANTYGLEGELLTRSTSGSMLTYGYDDSQRLVREADSGGISTTEWDSADNRLRTGSETSDSTYDAANKLLQSQDASFDYDDSGNLIRRQDLDDYGSGGTVNYLYDALDRLKEVKDGSNRLIARYEYDPFGFRVSKETPDNGGRVLFLHGDEGLLAEVLPSGDVVRSYGWTPEAEYGAAPVFLRASGQYYFYVLDSIGTPQLLIDGRGEIVWKVKEMSAFGEITAEAGSVEQLLRFPGQYFDAETGLYYNVNRYYSPDLGRYISADPIGLLGGFNRYSYADADPVNLVDLYGLNVGAPGTAEGFIPVWGSGREAVNDFQCGRIGWGLFNSALAIGDATGIGYVGKALAKGGFKVMRLTFKAYFKSRNWKSMQQRLSRWGVVPKNSRKMQRDLWLETDHIWIPQRLRWSHWIQNFPLNLQFNVLHDLNIRFIEMGIFERLKYLEPWRKAGLLGTGTYLTGLLPQPGKDAETEEAESCECN